MTGLFQTLSEALRAEQPVALAEIIEGPAELLGGKLLILPGQPTPVIGSVGDPNLDRVIARDAEGELAAGLTVTRHYGRNGEARARDISVFIESFAPPPRMIIFGAVDFTPPSPKWPRSSAIASPSATPARCLPPGLVSPWPTKWSCPGRTSTWPRSAALSAPGTRSAS